jgi:hypothetical protein
MRQFICLCVVAAGSLALMVPAATAAAAGAAAGLPCARTTIASLKQPVGPAQYQSGSLRLRNGASLRFQGTPEELAMAKDLAVGDAVAACYGPLRTYADAGPSRTVTVLDLVNGGYYASLIGTWKPR